MASDRRSLFRGLIAGGPAVTMAAAGGREAVARGNGKATAREDAGSHARLKPEAGVDQTQALQRAIDEAALRGNTLHLPPGRFLAAQLQFRPGVKIEGSGLRTVLALSSGSGPLFAGDGAHGCAISRMRLEGNPREAGDEGGLVEINNSRDVCLEDINLVGSAGHGMKLFRCSGRVLSCNVRDVRLSAIFSLDGHAMIIDGNRVSDCANNGILVWRSKPGADGTRVSGNIIERIAAVAGGSGQNGNGVNVFRANGVLVSGNRISDCAYTGVRANSASDVQIVANSVMRAGEVALYAEFAFEGAVIAQNIVDGAAAGISVTNFNEGGRLAVVQGNLIRNLVRREMEPVDKRGEGISVEADATVTGNTIEGAPTAGIVIGWGAYVRNVTATGNVIRASRHGILIAKHPNARSVLVAQNVISGAVGGAVRLMDNGQALGPDLTFGSSGEAPIHVTGNVTVDSGA
ncbi:MAG: TIGR03808 family TAT-translocated repetitive protein [Hyphomicrobiaceae bacterium]